MRAICSALVVMTMMVSGALAEVPMSSQGGLAPGKPAGIRQAELETGGIILVAGIVAVAAVIAIVVSTSNNTNSSTPGTTS
jgi:hypothetical protein